MSKAIGRRSWLAALCAAMLCLGLGAAPAQALEPLLIYTPTPPPPIPPQPKIPPPTGYLEAPCGVAVDASGRFYVSDYYHHTIDVFSSGAGYEGQLSEVDPLDGPCGLALDASGNLYVNNYHRNVQRFDPFPSSAPGPIFDAAQHPTGVAVDPATGDLYVDSRTYIAHYEAPVEAGEEPIEKIGIGSLEDGYGLAFSGFPATAGRLYVADAADDTVKVYDPALDLNDPVATIDGSATAGGDFTSLRDSALAVDHVSGELYLADNLQPKNTERPQAPIEVFDSGGAYQGHLKYLITDALPPGLAVDNSATAAQGRVYVTSGNTIESSIFIYPPSPATTGAPVCRPGVLCPPGAIPPAFGSLGAGQSAQAESASAATSGASEAPQGATASEVTQKGSLRVNLDGKLSPSKLPREGTAPIAVSVGWKVSSTDGSALPKLKRLRIEINRHGHFDSTGLPTCPYDRIQPASSSRALANCRSGLVGQGSFNAEIALKGQEPYATKGRLLVFNGKSGGKPVLFGQIYSPYPFATSFVIVFEVQKIGKGTYGTALSATLPKALSSWGNLTGIEMRLSRRYSVRGKRRSYISAGCPAPKGFAQVSFPLARASMGFGDGRTLTSTLTRSCRVR